MGHRWTNHPYLLCRSVAPVPESGAAAHEYPARPPSRACGGRPCMDVHAPQRQAPKIRPQRKPLVGASRLRRGVNLRSQTGLDRTNAALFLCNGGSGQQNNKVLFPSCFPVASE